MSLQVILAQAGPLPITATFNAPGDEPMYLDVNGSIWTQSQDQLIGIVVALDGETRDLTKFRPNNRLPYLFARRDGSAACCI